MNGIDPKVLADYVTTANNPKYGGDTKIINSKFPELSGYDEQVLADYIVTANNPKYKGDYGIINSKFPELFSDTPQQVEQKKNLQEPQTQVNPDDVSGQTPTPQPIQTGQVTPTSEDTQPDTNSDWRNFVNQVVDFNEPKETLVAKEFEGKTPADFRAEQKVVDKNVDTLLKTPSEIQEKARKLSDAEKVVDETGFASVSESTKEEYDDKAPEKAEPITQKETEGIIKAEDMDVLLEKPNPFPLATIDAVRYKTKELQRDNLKSEINNWKQSTGGDANDYFDYQRFYEEEVKKSGIDFENMDDMTPAELDKFNQDTFNKYANKDKTSLSGEDTGFIGTINENINYVFNNVLTGSIMGRGILGIKSVMDAAWKTGQEIAENGINAEVTTVGEAYRRNIKMHSEYAAGYKDVSMAIDAITMASVLAFDIYAFGAMGGTSAEIINAIWRGGANIAKLVGVPESFANSIGINVVSKIIKSGLNMGFTLAQYNAASSYIDTLGEKKISEIEWDDHKAALNSGAEGMVAGLAAGTIAGISSAIIQRTNAQLISKLYQTDAATGKLIVNAGDVGTKIKAVSFVGNTISTMLEGGAFTVVGASMRGDLDKLTWQDAFKESIKFLFAMRLQPGAIKGKLKEMNRTFIMDANFKPENAFKDKYDVDFNDAEMKSAGVKDKQEIIDKSKNNDWLNEIMFNPEISSMFKLKVFAGNGIYFKKSFDIETSQYVKEDGTHYLKSYDKDGNLVDIREFDSEASAKKMEVFLYGINLTNKAVKSVEGISAEGIDIINAKYEATPEKLLELNEAFKKAPSGQNAKDREAIRNFNKETETVKANEQKVIQKKAIENEAKAKEVADKAKPEKTETVEPKVTEIEYEDKKYTVTETEGQENVVMEKDAYDKLIPIRDTEIEAKVKELYDKENKQGLPSKVKEGETPIETKPVESTGKEEVKASRDVQAPKEEKVSERTQEKAVEVEKAPEISSEKLVYKAKDIEIITTKKIKEGSKLEAKEIEEFSATVEEMMNQVKINDVTQKEVKKMFTELKKAESAVKSETRDRRREKALGKIAKVINEAVYRTQDKQFEKVTNKISEDFSTEKMEVVTKGNEVKLKTPEAGEAYDIKVKADELVVGKNEEQLRNEIRDIEAGEVVEGVSDGNEIVEIMSREFALKRLEYNSLKSQFKDATNSEREIILKDLAELQGSLKEWSKEKRDERKKELEDLKKERNERGDKVRNIFTKNRDAATNAFKDISAITRQAFDEFKTGKKSKEETLYTIARGLTDLITGRTGESAATQEMRYQLFLKPKVLQDLIKLQSDLFDKFEKGVTEKEYKEIEKEYERILKPTSEGSFITKFARSRKIITPIGLQYENIDTLMRKFASSKEQYDYLKTEISDKIYEGEVNAIKIKTELKDVLKKDFDATIGNNKELNKNFDKKTKKLGITLSQVKKWGKWVMVDGGRERKYEELEKSSEEFKEMSYSEILYLKAGFENARARAKLESQFTEESFERLEAHVDKIFNEYPELRTFLDKVRTNIFDKTHDITNKTYKNINRLDLLKELNYIPQVGENNKNLFEFAGAGIKNNINTVSVDAPFTKVARGGGKLKLISFSDAVVSHIENVGEYSGKAELVKSLKYIIGDRELNKSIKDNITVIEPTIISKFYTAKGQSYVNEILKGFLEDFAGVQGSDSKAVAMMRQFTNPIAAMMLRFNPSVPLKQLLSASNYIVNYKAHGKIGDIQGLNELSWIVNNNPLLALKSGLHRTFYKEFFNSPQVRERLKNTNFYDEFRGSFWDKFTKKGKYRLKKRDFEKLRTVIFKDIMGGMGGIKWGDIGAFFLGGKSNWIAFTKDFKATPEYAKLLKEKGVESADRAMYDYANDKLFKESSASQQSHYVAMRSHYQRRNILSPVFPFATTPIQYYQQTWKHLNSAYDDIIIGKKAPKLTDVKGILNFGFVQPTIFAWATDAMIDLLNPAQKLTAEDEEKKLNEMEDATKALLWTVELTAPLIQGNRAAFNLVTSLVNKRQGDEKFPYKPIQAISAVMKSYNFFTNRLPQLSKKNNGKPFTSWSLANQLEVAQGVLFMTDITTGAGLHNIVKQVRRTRNELYKDDDIVNKLLKGDDSDFYIENPASVEGSLYIENPPSKDE